MSNSKIRCAIIIPSYREFLALPKLLEALSVKLMDSGVVIVAEDCDGMARLQIVNVCQNALAQSKAKLDFVFAEKKSGRGAAVRRGMVHAKKNYPNLLSILGCETDGSHQPFDILKVKNEIKQWDLLIGSHYLIDCKITGWPLARRIFSKMLNTMIPFILGIGVKDITNGLRSYSISAVNHIFDVPAHNPGFIYLFEQAFLSHKNKLNIEEIPIEFVNRSLGESTVTWREILNSILGLAELAIRKILKG